LPAQEFFCTFPPPAPQGWEDCGFFEQAPPLATRATIVNEIWTSSRRADDALALEAHALARELVRRHRN
jgi:hypothetical protein